MVTEVIAALVELTDLAATMGRPVPANAGSRSTYLRLSMIQRQPVVGQARFCRSRAPRRCGQNGQPFHASSSTAATCSGGGTKSDPRTYRPDRSPAIGSLLHVELSQ